MDYAEWERFKRSATYSGYVERTSRMRNIVGIRDTFLKDNYLSTDIRIPVTLVGTNSGRAVATNAMRGQVWDNFSSEDYKELPAVGAVRFYNPYSSLRATRNVPGRRLSGATTMRTLRRPGPGLLSSGLAREPVGDRTLPSQQCARSLHA